MILDTGANWIRLNESDNRFVELHRLLVQAEKYVQIRDPRTTKCDYWGICKNDATENLVVKCGETYEGEKLAITYKDVMRAFPELKALMNELKLQPYIGKNYIGNWGIHRHSYGNRGQWNICVLGKGNRKATINFHNVVDSTTQYGKCTSHYFFHILDDSEKTEIVETINVKEGQMYSLNVWEWHSHITSSKTNHAECFLLHFKDVESKEETLGLLKSLNETSWLSEKIKGLLAWFR